ncbi:hypothetical protein R5W24_003334 [Gemmata sp. JC717]|uniref:hypothetical protein n=1 Tax=Gemmata algarum TaxID=2975278 RepID=UPI0021BADB39|nr:hypothetical protein [Gemmata algarum]MDY3554215.1 hypothetical protein [Gemmata algarum]
MIWHYTPATHLSLIVNDGIIKVSTVDFPQREQQAVWFSSNTVFEHTSATLARRTKNGLEELPPTRFGYGRIGIDEADAPHNFDEYLRQSKLPNHMRDHLIDRAEAVNAKPSEWYATFKPVPKEKWKRIELLWNHNWVGIRLAAEHNLGQIIAQCIKAWSQGREVAIVQPPQAGRNSG